MGGNYQANYYGEESGGQIEWAGIGNLARNVSEWSVMSFFFVLQKARDAHREQQTLQQLEADHRCVAELLMHSGNGKGNASDPQSRQEHLLAYAAEREERVRGFLDALQQRRDGYFTHLTSPVALA